MTSLIDDLVMRVSRANWATGSGRRLVIVRMNLKRKCATPRGKHGSREAANSFGPAERPLGALAFVLADRITQACDKKAPLVGGASRDEQ
jgi:hypothetical protein